MSQGSEEAKDAKVCLQLLPQLQAILSGPQRPTNLKLELAAIIDVGEHFVKATYFLEGMVLWFLLVTRD